MALAYNAIDETPLREGLFHRYRQVRSDSERLCQPLLNEDYVIQVITEASPPKWHLAHVSWFFETFLLKPFQPTYRPFHPQYEILFNSYYNSVGEQFPRPQRGLLSRPSVDTVYRYRQHVDEAMHHLMEQVDDDDWTEVSRRIALGLNHEQQHQELLLTDIKANFGFNPLYPAYHESALAQRDIEAAALSFVEFDGDIVEIGHEGEGFAFDNESPRHQVLLQPFALANRPVTNGEYLQFIEDGGYTIPTLWLSDGWSTVQQQKWYAPMHWRQIDGEWFEFTLNGLMPLQASLPLCHVSYYEADAFAQWAGHRLPSEQEWEAAAQQQSAVDGHFRDEERLHPDVASEERSGLLQLFGDVWEWTSSAYGPYPGYRQAEGAFGEYNGKFMSNQFVVRGGSCVTPRDHFRISYRNFFYGHDRWQFLGIRLAR